MVCDRSNQVTHSVGMGPAVNMRDRGVGLMPDGIYCAAIYFASLPIIQLYQIDNGAVLGIAGGLAIAPIVAGDVLSFYHREDSGLATYHISLNGKTVIALSGQTPIHGGHLVTDLPGLTGPVTNPDQRMSCGKWWVTGSDGGLL